MIDNLSSLILKERQTFGQIGDVTCKRVPVSHSSPWSIPANPLKPVYQRIRVVNKRKSLLESQDLGAFKIFFRFTKFFKSRFFVQIYMAKVMAETQYPDFQTSLYLLIPPLQVLPQPSAPHGSTMTRSPGTGAQVHPGMSPAGTALRDSPNDFPSILPQFLSQSSDSSQTVDF